MIGVLGLISFFLGNLSDKQLKLSKGILYSALIAAIFSIICFFAADFNGTNDYSYANYLFSIFVWIFSAYFVVRMIWSTHGNNNYRTLVSYVAAVSALQCILAIVMDKVPSVKNVVNSFIAQGQDFLEEINRLYAIGASLDSAGVRFSFVLILIAFLLIEDTVVQKRKRLLTFYLLCFFIITIIGNMISRTTTVGVLISVVPILLSIGIQRLVISGRRIQLILTFIGITIVFVGVSVFLYNSDPYFYDQLRFAFEGFFNWAETGEWSTSSTDKLQANMWIWPEDTKTWIIGTGLFGNWAWGTDIGYCRFIMYCGLIGFSTFAILFLYNTVYFASLFPRYKYLFWSLLLLAFIIWSKVSTDIFQVFALFHWITFHDISIDKDENEDSLLHSGDI